jgi:hypothetical protein
MPEEELGKEQGKSTSGISNFLSESAGFCGFVAEQAAQN